MAKPLSIPGISARETNTGSGSHFTRRLKRRVNDELTGIFKFKIPVWQNDFRSRRDERLRRRESGTEPVTLIFPLVLARVHDATTGLFVVETGSEMVDFFCGDIDLEGCREVGTEDGRAVSISKIRISLLAKKVALAREDFVGAVSLKEISSADMCVEDLGLRSRADGSKPLDMPARLVTMFPDGHKRAVNKLVYGVGYPFP
ncbi:hypothetical protein B0H17DRAFT_1140243 [Mycena rosella]|uniref:Uncharacterized protein n=1 Tax=Mycena rosella TaxID=1033263 RepID=A0AAD7G809_MYCRO|nr:hypothetical protein B0H17DRAFT_1140243 [Mycena rosella]